MKLSRIDEYLNRRVLPASDLGLLQSAFAWSMTRLAILPVLHIGDQWKWARQREHLMLESRSIVVSMRRIWATLLVAVFCFALIGPAMFVPTGDQKLPPCCRKNGKHHCALAQRQESTSGLSFQAGRCAFFANNQTLPPIPTVGMPKVGQTILATVLSHRTPRPRTEKLGGIPFDRTGQKRGPPSIVFSNRRMSLESR
jgi:hypothetical protein